MKVAILQGAGHRFVDIVNGLGEAMLVVDQSLYVGQQAFAVLSEGDAGSTSCQKGKSGLFLQGGNGMADAGLGVVKNLSSLCNIADFGGFQKNFIAV